MNIVFDLGNVLLKWDLRFLYTQYFNSEEEMEWRQVSRDKTTFSTPEQVPRHCGFR